MDAMVLQTNAPARTVKPCGPGTPTLVPSEWMILFTTGASKPGTPGRARSKP